MSSWYWRTRTHSQDKIKIDSFLELISWKSEWGYWIRNCWKQKAIRLNRKAETKYWGLKSVVVVYKLRVEES